METSKYECGDSFILGELDDSFSEEIVSLLSEERVILEVQGFALTYEGELVYDLLVEGSEEFRWLLTEHELDMYCTHLGSGGRDIRFALIDL